MCNDPFCKHPYVCANCHAECGEDEANMRTGCQACLAAVLEDVLDTWTFLVECGIRPDPYELDPNKLLSVYKLVTGKAIPVEAGR